MQKDLFKSKYGPLHGSDWIRTIPAEDRRVFSSLGFTASDYGRSGGRALAAKYGPGYMAKIGARGAVVANLTKEVKKQIREASYESY